MCVVLPTYLTLLSPQPQLLTHQHSPVCLLQIRDYSQLPVNAQKYIERIEELTGVPVRWIGVGPAREALIEKI